MSKPEYVYIVRYGTDDSAHNIGAAKTLERAKEIAQDHDTEHYAPDLRHTIEWLDMDEELYETVAVERSTPSFGYSMYAIDKVEVSV